MSRCHRGTGDTPQENTHTHGWVALGTIPGAGMLQEYLGLSGFASRDLLPLTLTGKRPSSKRGLKK